MIDKFEGSYRWLSNFWEVPVVYEGVNWPTAEHAYQAAKFEDHIIRNKILDNPNPRSAKKYGKSQGMRTDWDNIKLRIMHDIVAAKFNQHHMLAEQLLATGNKQLIEGNWWGDKFWGVCKGEGENHLGKILMQVREALKNGRNRD